MVKLRSKAKEVTHLLAILLIAPGVLDLHQGVRTSEGPA